ncbi:hypothetical protein [Bacillus thuringiensis]|uniref:hypothetical protein n=1 Tax=Bacillus thuringiensis TaxID=1428 RepID=UPI000BF2B3EE|nr:hypothetical protein [Bacillus thuringiensis]PFF24139.1 hypothetical protein CN332_20295 [Bacillus thuringiensis]
MIIPIPAIPGLYADLDMDAVDGGYKAKGTLYYLGIKLGSETHESKNPNAGEFSYMKRNFKGPLISGFVELWIRWKENKAVLVAVGKEGIRGQSFKREKWMDF